MAPDDDLPNPEEVGKDFRIPTQRREGAPVGKPDEFDDVIKRQLERGTRREVQAPVPSPAGSPRRREGR